METLGNSEILTCKFLSYITQLFFFKYKKLIEYISRRLAEWFQWAEQDNYHLFGLLLVIYCKP